jgi:hypothetical protein
LKKTKFSNLFKLFFCKFLASIHLANAGGASFEPNCNDAACKSPDFLKAVDDYHDEEATFLAELNELAKQRPLTLKHGENVTDLIAVYSENLLPKFTKVKFARDECGKFCFDGVEEAEKNLKIWDCDLTSMITEATINKNIP